MFYIASNSSDVTRETDQRPDFQTPKIVRSLSEVPTKLLYDSSWSDLYVLYRWNCDWVSFGSEEATENAAVENAIRSTQNASLCWYDGV